MNDVPIWHGPSNDEWQLPLGQLALSYVVEGHVVVRNVTDEDLRTPGNLLRARTDNLGQLVARELRDNGCRCRLCIICSCVPPYIGNTLDAAARLLCFGLRLRHIERSYHTMLQGIYTAIPYKASVNVCVMVARICTQ